MEESNNNTLRCSHCGNQIADGDDYEYVNGLPACIDCYEHFT